MRRALGVAVLVAPCALLFMLCGCSKERGSEIEKRPGKTAEMMELEGRVRDLERVVNASEQQKVATAFAKDTGLSISYIPETPWSPGCLSMAKKGSSRSFVFCGTRLIEVKDEITTLDDFTTDPWRSY